MSRFVLSLRCAMFLLACSAVGVDNSTALAQSPAIRNQPNTASRAYHGADMRDRFGAVNTQYEDSSYSCSDGSCNGDGGCNSGYGGCDSGCNSGYGGCDSGCNSGYGGCDSGCNSGYGGYDSSCGGYCDGGCDSGYSGCDSGCGDCGGYPGMCDSGCSSGCGCAPQAHAQKRIMLFGDYLFLRVADADVAHAQQQDGIGGAGTVPYGTIGTVDMDYQSGYRVGGGVACGPCSGVMFSYSFFESESFSSLDPPFIPGGAGAVGSLVHHPGAAITASTGPVDATYDVDFQMADLVYTGVLSCGPRHSLDYLVGAQYGHLDQDFSQTGVFGGGQFGTIDTSTEIDFDGGGLKAGLVGESRVGGGCSAYGRLTGAVMSGQFRSNYLMYNSTIDTTLAEAIWKDNRVVPHLEYELGFAWTSCNECVRLSTGYMFSHWMNTVTTSEFIDAVQANNYVDIGETITFDGLVTRFECRW